MLQLLENYGRFKVWLFTAATCFIFQGAISEKSLGGNHLNPETFMTISEMIQFWGYPSEEYQVLTDDGYYLQVNRIPHGAHKSGKKGLAVLIVHGTLADGQIWVTNTPNNSLGFFLADAGYDVWLLNCRGSSWSRRHQYLSIDQELFWDFSFHEMGIYDVPATINLILEKTQQDRIYYIGHSQGASIGLIAFSVMPQLGQKIKLFTMLAPTYTFAIGRGVVPFSLLIPDEIIWLIFGNKEFCVLSNKVKAFLAPLCSHPIIAKLCVRKLCVYSTENVNATRADVYTVVIPDFTSVKTMIHWKQIVKAYKFQYFDYGSNNKAVYNMTSPPVYKVEDMIVPTAVWSGAKDNIADHKNVEHLLPHIKHLVFYQSIPYWGHDDFLVGLNAPELLYPNVLSMMNMYQ